MNDINAMVPQDDIRTLVPKNDYREIVKDIAGQVAKTVDLAGKVKVTSEETFTVANHTLGQVKMLLKQVDKARKEFTDPINIMTKTVNGAFGPYKMNLSLAETKLKKQMGAWFDATEAKAKKERDDLERKMQQDRDKAEKKARDAGKSEQQVEGAGDMASMKREARSDVITAPVKTQHAGASSASFRKIWKWELLDINQVPRSLMMLNEKEVNIKVTREGARDISGIRIFEATSVAGR